MTFICCKYKQIRHLSDIFIIEISILGLLGVLAIEIPEDFKLAFLVIEKYNFPKVA